MIINDLHFIGLNFSCEAKYYEPEHYDDAALTYAAAALIECLAI